MAIIIPSKNIYERSNNKVLDNKIKSVEIDATTIGFSEESNVVVYNTEIKNYTPSFSNNSVQDFPHKTIDTNFYVSYIKTYNPYYIQDYTLTIPKTHIDKFIKDIYSGKDENENNNITLTVQVQKSVGQATGTIDINNSTILAQTISNVVKEKSLYLEKSMFTYTYDISSSESLTADGSNIDTFNNISTQTFSSDEDNYYITLSFLVGFEKIGLSGYAPFTQEAGYPTVNGVGVYEKYEFQQATITFKGVLINIIVDSKTIPFGETVNPKFNFSVENNELLQISTNGSFDIPTIIANKTMEQYANGKETAEIRCSISDYKNEDGTYAIKIPKQKSEVDIDSILVTTNLTNGTVNISVAKPLDYDVQIKGICTYSLATREAVIPKHFDVILQKGETSASVQIYSSPSFLQSMELTNVEKQLQGFRMQFQEGDIVIPYVLGVNGIDKPMSLNKDNSPKEFEVVSTEIYYDGAVWQKLILQEFNKKE